LPRPVNSDIEWRYRTATGRERIIESAWQKLLVMSVAR